MVVRVVDVAVCVACLDGDVCAASGGDGGASSVEKKTNLIQKYKIVL